MNICGISDLFSLQKSIKTFILSGLVIYNPYFGKK